MDGEMIKKLVGKKVYVELNSNRRYTGIIESVDDLASPIVFVYLTDKFGEMVIFSSKETRLIQEERE